MKLRACALAMAALSVVLAVPVRARAQTAPAAPEAPTTTDPEKLFSDALALMNDEKFEEARVLLEEAQVRDPGIGTQFNLAICYEKLGKLGTAWRNYGAVQQLAHASGKSQREENARLKLEELRPRLSVLVLDAAAAGEGATIRVDGAVVPPSEWSSYPVDPGLHRVDATAPARRPWSDTVAAPGEGESVTLRVPVLASTVETKVVTVSEPTSDGRRTIGFVLGGIGVAGLVTATVTGVVILGDKASADRSCKPKCANADGTPNQSAIDDVNEGKTLVPINLVAWVVAAAGLGVGTYFILSSGKKVTPMAGAHALGLVFSSPL